MITYKYIELQDSGKLAVLKLNRPDKRNALNREMIDELKSAFEYLTNESQSVLLQVLGKGKSFCAGADIQWFQSLKKSNEATIQEEFKAVADMLHAFYHIPQVCVSFIHGSVIGGGVGLVACSDFAIAAPFTKFSFSEINLGLIPATISPYIVKKIGLNQAQRLFYSGEEFDEKMALQLGLIEELAAGVEQQGEKTLIERLLEKPHSALLAMKKLLRGIESNDISEINQDLSSKLIAGLIQNDKTQSLLNNFTK